MGRAALALTRRGAERAIRKAHEGSVDRVLVVFGSRAHQVLEAEAIGAGFVDRQLADLRVNPDLLALPVRLDLVEPRDFIVGDFGERLE